MLETVREYALELIGSERAQSSRSSAAGGETLGPKPDMFRLCRMA